MRTTPSGSDARTQLVDAIRDNARRAPDAPLIGDAQTMRSRAEVLAIIDAKAAAFRAAGVGTTSRLASIGAPSLDLVTDVFAVMAVGGTVVPLPATITAWELARLEKSVPITHLTSPARSTLTVGEVCHEQGGRILSTAREQGGFDQYDAATAQLTSGTTGHQRAALRSASAIACEAEAYRHCLSLDPDETIFCAVPAHHAYAFGLCVVAATITGVPVRYLPADQPRTLLRLLAEAGGGLVPSVPPMLRLLAAAIRPSTDIGSARFLTAGMPLDLGTIAAVRDRVGAPLGQVYGTTETGPICIEAPGSAAVALGRQGRPAPGVETRLATGGDPATEHPFLVRSQMAMMGYADGTGIDRAPVADGWFRTGDLVRRTDHGISVVGRVATSINVAGAKVSPEEIEAAVMAFPGVTCCLAYPIADETLGQRIGLRVVPEQVDVHDLERFLRERLSPVLLPYRYQTCDALATTATGKVLRHQPGAEDA